MDGTIVGALITLGGLMLINLLILAYTYGKIVSKVDDLCKRHNNTEQRLARVEKELTELAVKKRGG